MTTVEREELLWDKVETMARNTSMVYKIRSILDKIDTAKLAQRKGQRIAQDRSAKKERTFFAAPKGTVAMAP